MNRVSVSSRWCAGLFAWTAFRSSTVVAARAVVLMDARTEVFKFAILRLGVEVDKKREREAVIRWTRW